MARGYTLIELLVTAAVMAIVMAAVLGALMANQRQYVSHADLADMQSNLRMASVQIERAIALAGYGIDPNYAVETRALANDGTELAGGTRDGSGPNRSDELVLQYRDPLFSRRVVAASAATITMDRALEVGESIVQGQRLMVICADGSAAAYVTADRVAGPVITLTANGAYPFREQARLAAGAAGESGCFHDGSAFVTRVERRHFYIANLRDVSGGTRPALMLSRGVNLDGDAIIDERPNNWPNGVSTDTGDAEVIALDIEQLQVAYGINRPSDALAARYGLTSAAPDSDRNWIYGDSPGVAESPPFTTGVWAGTVTGPGAAHARPPFLARDPSCASGDVADATTCTYGGMRRYLGHVGNIRTIRYSLSARSPHEVPEVVPGTPLQPIASEPAITLENLSGLITPTRHRRQVLRGSGSLRNVFQRKHFPPPIDPSTDLNVAGG